MILFPLLGVVLNGFFGNRWSGKAAGILASTMIGASFVVAVMITMQLIGMDPHHRMEEIKYFTWIKVGGLNLDFGFLIDPLTTVMILVVTGISTLIHIYSIGYMHGDSRMRLFFVYLNLFVFFMLVLVLGNSYPIMFIGWEGVGLASYLLIGFWWEDQSKAEAGMKAFVVNRIGDFGMLVAMFLLFSHLGTLTFTEVFDAAAIKWGHHIGNATITAITLMLLLGATGKSAQLPLYVWLPDAMAGPTPVSALIHAATMVTAGVYMIARSNLLYMLAPTSMTVVALVGGLTAFFAATIGLKQMDIKKVLAYSTVSQLGYMVMACGIGAFGAGVFHLMTHAFFKALLFLGSGAVIHTMHGALHHVHDHHTDPQDIRNMGGLRKYIPVTFSTFFIATLAIAGIPGLSGFFSKDEILAQSFASGNMLAYGLGLAAAVITAFYMFRLVFLTFYGEYKGPEGSAEGLHESPKSMTVPLIILAFLAIVGGYVGLPIVLGENVNLFHNYMHPVFAHGQEVVHHHANHLSHATEWLLIGISVAAALVGIFLAWTIYRKQGKVALPDAAQAGIDKVLLNKYYVDELYNFIVIKPLIGICNFAWKIFDAGFIDGILVLGSAKSVRWIGGGVRRLQTGVVGNYAFMLAVGILVLLIAFLVN
ncbi:NADH-quinone oxidoreductase subunit L [bacterium]|nr:NADH-quinone oxidoreductase subunit L [bacterium]